MKNAIIEAVERIEDKIIKARRELHRFPELSFEEYKTSDFICDYLDEIGIPYKRNIAKTGVVAEIKGREEGKTVLLRADIDALPIEELNENDYASKNKGVMHACGHDIHTAVMLGVCEILWGFRDKLCGMVKIAFQPGEETTGGAKLMIDEGILNNPEVDICAAFHVDPDLDCGDVRIKEGSLYASPDNFEIKVKGRSGHAAQPHDCIDPIYISAQIITNLQSIVSRKISPFDTAVISVGSIHSGTAPNIIPETAEITGTARSMTPALREKLKSEIGNTVKEICNLYGAEFEYNFIYLYPPLINDSKTCKIISESAEKYANVIYGGEATMAGEDFAYFAEKVPSSLVKLGCGKGAPIHNAKFMPDEDCIKTGVCIMSDFVLEYLGGK